MIAGRDFGSLILAMVALRAYDADEAEVQATSFCNYSDAFSNFGNVRFPTDARNCPRGQRYQGCIVAR